ncbi:hypothetical protein [Pseudovibrio brasiliensis]|uniref:Uncharacterized protein n=1 Tax=Pseudovibrio brasiliensis TaxID=1898042 RepID=A0ABX8AH15_9HYPH|nr:hypothetical protein [Pseudovibrio brasiliensis]QUS54367.1 hypothetical protein KGB56_13275 [Pseudovibrio brasiliensis]
MTAVSSIGSTPVSNAIDGNIQLDRPVAAKSVESIPSASQLLSVGVSAAFGLQPPPDTANLEVLVGQVVARFEEIQASLKEQNLIGQSEKVRSARSELLQSLALQEDIAADIEALDLQQQEQEGQLSDLQTSLASKQDELANLPATVPSDPDDPDSELIQDPKEVARLNGEIAQINTSIGEVETAIADTVAQLDVKLEDLSESDAVQSLLRTALEEMAGAPKTGEMDESGQSTLEGILTDAATKLNATKPEFDQRHTVIEELRKEVRELADERVKDEKALMTLLEAEYALRLVGFVSNSISKSLSVAEQSVGGQDATDTTGRVQLLLDNGRV